MTTNEKTRTLHHDMEKKGALSRSENLAPTGVKWLLLSALLTGAQPAMPQTKTMDMVQDSTRTEIPQTKSEAKGTFYIDPAYSPTDRVGTMRLSGGSSVHGLNVTGLLDLTGTPKQPVDINSAGGKLTLGLPTNKVVQGTSLALEYNLSTQANDKLRGGVQYAYSVQDGVIVVKVYPLSDQGFDPYTFIYADKKFGKYKVSAFGSADIKSKSFYGEAEASYQLTKKIAPFVQGRFGATHTSKVHTNAYVGMRVKL